MAGVWPSSAQCQGQVCVLATRLQWLHHCYCMAECEPSGSINVGQYWASLVCIFGSLLVSFNTKSVTMTDVSCPV